ncbi:hypothetical protein MNBD_PLANCTO03-1521 [hydrothermal vent metagenome]|uniref:Uncharacterized protein n=1 Tax=hydrothermal vent metagenome TaxID=652676 RepID=A0A3B1DMG5_9ZZZZ
MCRTVVLRHELPDGSHHFDWLFEPEETDPADPEARVLLTWRLPTPPPPPHEAGSSTLAAIRLPLHRLLYLDYQGPIEGGRGSVQQVASGQAEILADTPARFAARVSLGTQHFCVEGEPTAPPAWVFRFDPA